MSDETGRSATVPVRVKPGSRLNRAGGVYSGPFGPAVIIAVQARTVEGAATEAARRVLAAAIGVPPSLVALRSGHKSRDKLFTVSPAPDDLDLRINRLRAHR
jgi:hypothetical protein